MAVDLRTVSLPADKSIAMLLEQLQHNKPENFCNIT